MNGLRNSSTYRQRFALTFALGAAAVAVLALPFISGEGQTPARKPALNGAECDRLYRHQREVLRTDASHPLAPALRMNQAALESKSTAAAQKQYCLKNVTRAGFSCQIRAKTLHAILECQLRHAPGTGTAEARPPGGSQNESGTEQIATLTVKINRDSCQRAYRHMLAIYENAPELEELSNKRKLLEYWRSTAARKSFTERCLGQFRSSDLGCILSTSDPDVIQACLLEVPEE